MATPPADEKLLSVEDLAARWGVSEDVVRRHMKLDGLPHLQLGRSGGRRPMLRFRPEAVRAWEASRERAHDPMAADPAPTVGPAPVGWDGSDRLTRGRRGGKTRPA